MASVFGGHAVVAEGGLSFPGTPLQAAQGLTDHPDRMFEDMLAIGEDADRRWARLYVDRSVPEVFDWLQAMGVRFHSLGNVHGNSVSRYHLNPERGFGIVAPIYRACLQTPQHPVRLEHAHHAAAGRAWPRGGGRGDTHAPGRPVSSCARGRWCWRRAGSSRMWRWCASTGLPAIPVPPRLLSGAGVHAVGSGLELGARVGAAVGRLDHQWNYPRGIPDPRYPGSEPGAEPEPDHVSLDQPGGAPVRPGAHRQPPGAGGDGPAAGGAGLADLRRGRQVGPGDRRHRLDRSPQDRTPDPGQPGHHPAGRQPGGAGGEDQAAGGRTGAHHRALERLHRRGRRSGLRALLQAGGDVPDARHPCAPAGAQAAVPGDCHLSGDPQEHGRPGHRPRLPGAGWSGARHRRSVRRRRGHRVRGHQRQGVAGGDVHRACAASGPPGRPGAGTGGAKTRGGVAAAGGGGDRWAIRTRWPCATCHPLPQLLALQRKGYWHFDRVHTRVVEDRRDCSQCHAEMAPFRPGAHKIDRVAQVAPAGSATFRRRPGPDRRPATVRNRTVARARDSRIVRLRTARRRDRSHPV